MKSENLKNYGKKIALMGCKWSILNDLGIQNSISFSFEVGGTPFSCNWPSTMKSILNDKKNVEM